MRKLLEELPSRLVNEYQVQGGDLAILPIGSVEVLGPHLPMGAKGLLSQAFAKLLAERAKGLVLPLVPFAPAMGAGNRPGSIDVNESAVNQFVRAIVDDLHATGFRRILLITDLDYLRYYIPHEFYEDNAVALAGVHMREMFDGILPAKGLSLDSLILGACLVLGKTQIVEKSLQAAARWRKQGRKNQALSTAHARIKEIGIVGGYLPKGNHPVPPDEKLDPEAGERILRETAEAMVPALESLRTYNEYLSRRGSRGFLKGNWFRKTHEEALS